MMKQHYEFKRFLRKRAQTLLVLGVMISSFLSTDVMAQCTADAGTLTADSTPVTLEGGTATISATPNGDMVVPANFEVLYVLTSGEDLVIEAAEATPNFVVEDPGNYTIHTLIAETSDNSDPNYLDLSLINFGTTTGSDVLVLFATSGITCGALDVNGAPITVLEECTADAGTLTADASTVTLTGETVTISATPNGDIVVPENYEVLYVLTSGESLVIEAAGGAPSFDVDAAGDYTIHTLVAETTDNTDPNFLDLSVIDFGVTTGGDVLGIVTTAGLCASLDVAGAPITVEDCTADAGTLTADASTVTLTGETVTISATPNGDIVVPANYDVIYVLTSGESLVIEAAGGSPSFDVDAAGDYTIHTLVAETTDNSDPNFLDLSVIDFGVTTGGDVLGIVTTAGLCASLDVAGAPITVEDCTADAGTLTADASTVTLTGETVTISATPNGDIVVPENYEVLYVLTSGESLVIEAAGGAPSFDVDAAGDYTIHTLVAETTDNTDPNFLDLSVIDFGVTTGGDVLGIVTTAGLCASLDVAGAPITVEECTADAGTLTADASTVTLTGETVTISATPNGDIVVPENYEVVYVLTSGESLVIEAAGGTPSFDADAAGDYTIHTLVAETTDNTDPNFLDLSVIDFGVTTGVDVLGIVTTAGLCASLDVAGAPITVEDCTADAGTLTADASTVTLTGETVTISATPNGDIVVPENYEVVYVLTSGESLVIEAAGGTPSFDVDAAGDYTIHTLVAETTDNTDPNFLDLSVIDFGVTTGGDVLGIVTTAGLCASLDVAGALITVEDCTADAGTLTADASPVSLSNGTTTISATPNGDIVIPADYDVTYVLTLGENLVIVNAGPTPSFEVTEAGEYTIHTLVAETTDNTDPNFLDLSVINFGVTTGGDVLGIVTSAGLCASLDVAGAPIVVDDELSINDNPFETINFYPNPVKEELVLSNSRNLFIETVALYDLSGRIVKRISVNNNSAELNFNLSELSTGIYMMILNSEFGPFEKRIMKE